MAEATARQLNEFKKMLAKVCYFDISFIDDNKIREMFETNFESNLSLAERVLFNKYDEIKRREFAITGMDSAVDIFIPHIKNKKPTLLVTDNDNDGSLAQSVMMAAKKIDEDLFKHIHVEFSQNINPNKMLHGITLEVVDAWVEKNGYKKDDEMMILTADNGIQSKEEVELILKKYPNSKIIITDHHLPSDEYTPEESDRLKIVDPMYRPNGFFKNSELNISGANVFSWFLKSAIRKEYPKFDENRFEVMDNIERHSNAMDFVRTNLFNYPIKEYEIEENTTLRALMNINNSVRSFIKREISDSDIKRMKKINPDFEPDILKGAVDRVKNANLMAAKYIKLYKDFEKMAPIGKRRSAADHFYFSAVNYMIGDFDKEIDSINKNYIEQLRPLVFYYLSNPNKSGFETEFFSKLKDVFKELKKAEREIIDELRKLDLMHVIKDDAVTILYPKDFDLLKPFDRKLLMKVYNENNNGVFMAITHESPESNDEKFVANGSFRGIDYPSEKLMNDISEYYKGVDVRLKGHSFAAGVFMSSPKKMELKDLERLSGFINDRLLKMRENSSIKAEDRIEYVFDTTNMDIAKEINKLVRGYLPNLVSIEPLFKLGKTSRFISKRSGKAVTVNKMLEEEKYGYAVLELNFAGDALILPVETVRALANNNFKDYVRLSQIDGGAFIANSVVRKVELKPSNIINVPSSASVDESLLMDSYRELRKDGYSRKISREKMLSMELFKRNIAYGEEEFDRVEELLISQIDTMGVDKLVVLDVEANGLGKPEIFNVGTLDISIVPDSGIRISLDDYKKTIYDESERKNFSKKYLNGGSIKNVKYLKNSNEIIINRELEYEMMSRLIRGNDFYIMDNIRDLTGISQSSLNKEGDLTHIVDEEITERYKDFKIAMIAHNSPYDTGVIRGNMPKFLEYIKQKAIICDTAPLSKTGTLGYADMTVASLGIFQDALFYNSKHSDFSLISLVESGKDFNFPDIRGEFVLKKRKDTYFMVDKRKNIEQELPIDDDYFQGGLIIKPIPKNKVKFGVQFLLKNAGIRNMLLNKIKDKKIKIPEPSSFIKSSGVEDFYKEFCEGYNFGGNFNKNLVNYINYLNDKDEGLADKFREFIFGESDLKSSFLEDPDGFKAYNDELKMKKQKEINKVIESLNKEKITKDAADKKIKKIEEKYKQKIMEDDNMNGFEEAVEDFFEENADIYTAYTNNWEYQLLLEYYDPMKSVISKSDLERVSYHTSLPDDRIRKMVKEIYEYKKSIGIEKEPFYIKELHNNIDERGDMVIEHFAVISLLIAKHQNRYSNVMSSTPLKATLSAYAQSDITFARSERFAMTEANSASTRQLQNYSRINPSKEVINAKNIDKIILKNKYLQPTMNLIAEKSYNELNADDLEILEKDLNFIVAYDLLKQSDDYNIISRSAAIEAAMDYFDGYDLKSDFEMWMDSDFSESVLNKIVREIPLEIKEFVSKKEYKQNLIDIKGIYDYYNKISNENSSLLAEALEDLKEDYVTAYKRVYEKLGYVYVSTIKDDLKKVVESVYANIVANTGRVKTTSVKTMTGDKLDELKTLVPEMISYFEKEHNMKVDPENALDIIQAVESITKIDEDLSEMYKSAYNVVIKEDSNNYDDFKRISFFEFVNTRKLNRNKAALGYSELISKLMDKSRCKRNNELSIKKPKHPKNGKN